MGRRGIAALAALAWCASAQASFHTFQIDELYSSPDGSVQFVELHEAAGFAGENFLSGHALTSTQGATTRSFVFPSDLPSSDTAGRRVLIATPAFAAAAGVTPDYVMPAPFLFPDGGATINYAGVDAVTYSALPADGRSSIDRTGAVAAATPTNFAGQTGVLAPPPPPPPPPSPQASAVPATTRWAELVLLVALAGLALRALARSK
jgi:hypothetical protein